tara:strand:- start:84 stop:1907 length:1824 start_codon:yes stop_codon:yes gene_type:complete
MRLATITNVAYGATFALTVVSGVMMLLASNAHDRERAAVEQRYQLDKATSRLGRDIYAMSEHARQFVNTGDETYAVVYRRDEEELESVERRIEHIGDAGATQNELATLAEAIRWADTLHDEQVEAIAAYEQGDEARARQILFGPEYERELNRAEMLVQRFQDQLDGRIERVVNEAAAIAAMWKLLAEIVLVVTGLLFLCVLYFIFKRRVLHPVVRLSDVVSRLAAEDYATELPEVNQIDEIGDMAQAIRVFRENGLARQRLQAERDADSALRELLSRMTQRMQSCDTLEDFENVVRRFVPEIDPERAGRLYLFDEHRNAMVEACTWQKPVHSQAEFAPSSCWALRRGMPHRPQSDGIDVPCQHLALADGEISDSLCLPLMAQNETLGLLYLEVRDDSAGGSPTPANYIEMLAENISLALANLKLRDALRKMAMHDTLTGLSNRRNFEHVMEKLRTGEGDAAGRMSCLMLDVDHFKSFNDRFGHEAGDLVLSEVGKVLQKATREPEFAFRYGGEEFVMLLPDFDSEQAAARAEDIRSRIAALNLRHDGERLGRITISIGVASVPEHCDLSQMVQAADAALYRAKEGGRDRVELAQRRREAVAGSLQTG